MNESRFSETPDTVHGRLLEAVHLSGYTFERACAELEYLLDADRWKNVGNGFTDINAFLATLDLSELRIAVDQRKRLARRLAEIEASQRATARMLGVGEQTIARDLGRDRRGAPKGAGADEDGNKKDPTSAGSAPKGAPAAWFQADADPSREAKRIARNEEREVDREQLRTERPARALPAGKYQLLYVDPPWRYEHVVTESRAIENQYPTMPLDAICALDVPAADDAVLFLWATSPKLAEAIAVIAAWHFDYRTCAVWDKQTIGMGYYFRQQHELLLVAARGNSVVPDESARVSSLIVAPRGRHSEKPALVYDLLERMYPHFTERDRVELFARAPRAGWASWGNDPEVAS